MRVLHFSDVHVGMPLSQVALADWLNKRALGGLHLILQRGRQFRDAREKLAGLERFAREQSVDLVLFTGDYTALGLDGEMRRARESVEPLMKAPAGFVNVPGNHDVYVPGVVRQRMFERHFGATLYSDLPEYASDGPWPLVRLIGEEVAVVAVNSARPNPPWRSSGRIPPRAVEALHRLLRDERVSRRFVFVMTHYAPRLGNGRRDSFLHGMVNADDFLAACADLPRGAILCGHIHHRFRVRVEQVRPPIFCSGSATMARREGLWLFDVDGADVRATPCRWDRDRYCAETPAAVDG